jgi:hypothetical protein
MFQIFRYIFLQSLDEFAFHSQTLFDCEDLLLFQSEIVLVVDGDHSAELQPAVERLIGCELADHDVYFAAVVGEEGVVGDAEFDEFVHDDAEDEGQRAGYL